MAPSSSGPTGSSSGGDPARRDPAGPFGGIPDDVAGKIPLFAELQKLMSSSGPVNWELARQLAIAAAAAGDRAAGPAELDEVRDALRLADVWLDVATSLPAGVTSVEAWTRVQWVERTQPTWTTLCDPVAARVTAAMGTALPEEVRAQAGPLLGVLGSVGGLMFGAQVGQALGALAGEVLSSTDVGLPLGPAGLGALVVGNVVAFGEGLEVPVGEVRLYVALREAAHHRLYSHVPWLRAHVLGAVDAYARGINVDPEAISRAMSEIDPTDPESLQAALGGGLFQPQQTPEQQAALERLETALALVEGWVSDVVDTAAVNLPSSAALGETMRRRRASGGPAEQTFATLVGLELRPRRLREAAALWAAVRDARGVDARDATWSHPDLLPSAADLGDPAGFVDGAGEPLHAPDEDAPPHVEPDGPAQA
ncbi:MAG TPA: zinc-dependent metalloprotease [Mycobacteriales bacterium]|nr:zinc-dependent metalloprotease [Mycobacteriales bacterium]